jgi:hypothetical protein
MKKFAVLKKIGIFSATVVREFDEEADALEFAGLLTRSEDHKETRYFIAEVTEVPF